MTGPAVPSPGERAEAERWFRENPKRLRCLDTATAIALDLKHAAVLVRGVLADRDRAEAAPNPADDEPNLRSAVRDHQLGVSSPKVYADMARWYRGAAARPAAEPDITPGLEAVWKDGFDAGWRAAAGPAGDDIATTETTTEYRVTATAPTGPVSSAAHSVWDARGLARGWRDRGWTDVRIESMTETTIRTVSPWAPVDENGAS